MGFATNLGYVNSRPKLGMSRPQYCLLWVGSWVCHLTDLCYIFLICKTEKMKPLCLPHMIIVKPNDNIC